jgi:RNA polymerase sigma-B factor
MSPEVVPGVDGNLDLFAEYRRTGRRSVRNRIVEQHLGLAVHIANRLSSGRGNDDIEQVAMIGLVKAVDRFDPSFGVPFTAFAGRTIEGEIKRYFRDSTWAVKVPRSAKELHLAVRNGTDVLSKRLGRSPTVDELATHLQLSADDIVTGLAAAGARSIGTLDPGPDDSNDHNAALARHEPGYEAHDDRAAVAWLLETLPERERRIVELRFFGEMSQSDIAAEVGVSQMHVSRLLRAALERMRERAEPG